MKFTLQVCPSPWVFARSPDWVAGLPVGPRISEGLEENRQNGVLAHVASCQVRCLLVFGDEPLHGSEKGVELQPLGVTGANLSSQFAPGGISQELGSGALVWASLICLFVWVAIY